MGTIPIVLFVYNRPDHLRHTIEALVKNTLAEKSKLFIYSDGPKNQSDAEKIMSVRKYIHSISGFKEVEIIEREKNYGLAKSVITGVSEVFTSSSKVIIMEDDMISSRGFLSYMYELLNFYENNRTIFSVTGYTFPIKIPYDYPYEIYLAHRASSWGWGTWKDRWEKVDWDVNDYDFFIGDKTQTEKFKKGGDDLIRMLKNQKTGRIDSWAIIWTYTHFKNKAYCIYPVRSLIKNIGADESGVHMNKTKKYDVDLTEDNSTIPLIKDIKPNEEILKNFQTFFKKNILSSIINRINL